MSTIRERLQVKKKLEKRSIEGVGEVWLRRLTCNELLDMQSETGKGYIREIVALCLVNEDGTPVFSSKEVGELDWADVQPIGEEVKQMNRLDQEKAEKKSETPPSSPTSSTSPVT